MEKFLQNLQEAEKTIRTADHMIYVTFPLVKDKKLLIKIILDTKDAIVKCINAILQYEYIFKRVKLYSDQKSNFRTFIERCAPRYKLDKNDILIMLELFDLAEKHKKSSMEFIKEDKIIILSEKMQQKTISSEDAKKFIVLAKKIIKNTETKIKQNFT